MTNEQLFTDMLPNEEANLSGGSGYGRYGYYYKPFISAANAQADSAAVGGLINVANTKTTTVTAPGVALSSSKSNALSIG